MSKFRLTAAESIGTAALLACVALPLVVRMCSPSDTARADAARAAADSVAQARIDSMQQRDDSIRAARDSIRAARKQAKKQHSAQRRFKPERNRLDEKLN